MTEERNVLIVHTGGVGDLVLAGDLVHSIRQGWPRARIHLACRRAVAGVAGLMPSPPDAVTAFDLNPYAHEAPSTALLQEVGELGRALSESQPDILIAGAYKPTWMEWFLAARVKARRSVGATASRPPAGLLTVLLQQFHLESPGFDTPDAAAFPHEKARYAALARTAGVEPQEAPEWRLRAPEVEARDAWLKKLDLTEGGYLVCFPFGAVAEKRWPEERFLEVLQTVCSQYRVPPLLMGARGEEAGIDRMRAAMVCARGFIGDPGDLPAAAGLLAGCRAWVGNDTGPMHLAQAYRKPGVAVFGGGADRVYGPWAPGATGLIHPLPCFGCLWDCAFGHGLCVDSIPAGPVMEALARAMSEPPGPPEMRTVETLPPAMVGVIGLAASRYRESQASRKERFELLVELEHEAGLRLERLNESGRRAEELAAATEQRGRELMEKDSALGQMTNVAGERAQALAEKQAALDEILGVAGERERAILDLDAALRGRDAMLEEKEAALQAQAAALQAQAAALREQAAALEEKDAALAGLRAERDRLQAELDLPPHKALPRLLRKALRKNR